MLSSDDLTRMKATNVAIIGDRDTSIVIMRGDDDLDAQTVRLVDLGNRPQERLTVGGDVVNISLLVVGETDLDIQRGDTFWVGTEPFGEAGDQLYEVIFVRIDQEVKVVAEAKVFD